VPRCDGVVDHVPLLSWPHPVLLDAKRAAQHGTDGDRAETAEAQQADPDGGHADRDQAGDDGGRNVAETVFLLPPAGGGDVRVQIFTPLAERPFAGHPVLGTAFVVGAALGAAEIGRPSVLYATVAGEDDAIDSVEVGGSALIVAEDRFRVVPA
jgi:hypothetical protein